MEYYSRKIKMPFQEVLEKVTQNLRSQGFAVVTSIDIQETFKTKLNIAFRNYKILGACNPQLAYNAISLESHLGMMLPCNVVIQEHENGEVEVSAVNPLEGSVDFFDTTQVTNLAVEIGIRLRAAIDFIQRESSRVNGDALPTEGRPSKLNERIR
jgi:uncharacterized protein (DUF302 family)